MFRRVLALLLALTCPLAQASAFERITGTLRTAEPAAFPADATLTVELLDVSQPGARAERLARLTLPTRGRQAPLAFELPYHRDDAKPAHRYVLRATLSNSGGEVLFAGTQTALADGNRTVDLVLPPARSAAATLPLENTYWKLADLDGQPARAEPGEREAYLLLLAGRASGSSGCNKLMGSYQTDNRGQLALGPLAGTRMTCAPDVMAQESALFEACARTTSYRIEGDTLSLLRGDTVLARFQARQFK